MKSDAPVYSSGVDRKLTQKGKGIRIYTDTLKDNPDDRYPEAIGTSIDLFVDANPWFKSSAEFDVTKFRLVVSPSPTEELVKKKEDTFNYLGIEESSVDAFSDDLRKNIDVWMSNIHFDSSIMGSSPTWMTFVTFSIVVSWLKTLATLDDIRMLVRDATFRLKVSDYWGKMLVALQKISEESRNVKIEDFTDEDQERFQQVISDSCAQYIVQIIKIIAETNIINVLDLDRKLLVSTLNKKCSLRSGDDPFLGLDAREADIKSLLDRLEKALSNSHDVLYQLSGIATIEAFLGNEKAIVVDDLLVSEQSGRKVPLMDVFCLLDAQNKTHAFKDRIHALLDTMPKKNFDDVHIQVIAAWNSFLDVLFLNQDSRFFAFLKTKTLTTDLGVKDLTKVHGRMKAYLASKGEVKRTKAELLSVNIRSMENFKINNQERKRRFAAIFRDKSLRKDVVNAELILASQVKNPFVFGFDARFIQSPMNKMVSDDNRDYQIGAYIGTSKKKQREQAGKDRLTEPLIVLRSMILLLESDLFKGELGYALAEHLLVPIYYIAVRFKGDIGNRTTLISRMYSAVVRALQVRLLDRNSILNHAILALRSATPIPPKASTETLGEATGLEAAVGSDGEKKESVKTADLTTAAKEFDERFPAYGPLLKGTPPITSPIPVRAGKEPVVEAGFAFAMNDTPSVLVG